MIQHQTSIYSHNTKRFYPSSLPVGERAEDQVHSTDQDEDFEPSEWSLGFDTQMLDQLQRMNLSSITRKVFGCLETHKLLNKDAHQNDNNTIQVIKNCVEEALDESRTQLALKQTPYSIPSNQEVTESASPCDYEDKTDRTELSPSSVASSLLPIEALATNPSPTMISRQPSKLVDHVDSFTTQVVPWSSASFGTIEPIYEEPTYVTKSTNYVIEPARLLNQTGGSVSMQRLVMEGVPPVHGLQQNDHHHDGRGYLGTPGQCWPTLADSAGMFEIRGNSLDSGYGSFDLYPNCGQETFYWSQKAPSLHPSMVHGVTVGESTLMSKRELEEPPADLEGTPTGFEIGAENLITTQETC